MAIQRSNIANNSSVAANGGGGGGNNSGSRARDLSPISPRSANANSNAAQFNPRLILSQMISLQSFHYLILGVIFQINHVLFATSITMDRIFTAKYLDVWSATGWIDNAAILLSSLFGAVLLAIIVEKSKKCLDFSVTLFLIHIVTCSIYGGFPSTWDWWIVHTIGLIVMVVLGEYLCSKKELSDIPLLQL